MIRLNVYLIILLSTFSVWSDTKYDEVEQVELEISESDSEEGDTFNHAQKTSLYSVFIETVDTCFCVRVGPRKLAKILAIGGIAAFSFGVLGSFMSADWMAENVANEAAQKAFFFGFPLMISTPFFGGALVTWIKSCPKNTPPQTSHL